MTNDEQVARIGGVLLQLLNEQEVRAHRHGALLIGEELTIFALPGRSELLRKHIPASIGPSVLGVDATLRTSIVECSEHTATMLCGHTVPKYEQQRVLRFEEASILSRRLAASRPAPPAASAADRSAPRPIEARWSEWERTEDGFMRRAIGPLVVEVDEAAWNKHQRGGPGAWKILLGDRVLEQGDGCDRDTRVAEHVVKRANWMLARWARSALQELQDRIVHDRDTERREAQDTDESDLFRMEHRGAADALHRVVEMLGVMIAVEP